MGAGSGTGEGATYGAEAGDGRTQDRATHTTDEAFGAAEDAARDCSTSGLYCLAGGETAAALAVTRLYLPVKGGEFVTESLIADLAF